MLPLAIAGAAWARGGVYSGPERRHPVVADEDGGAEAIEGDSAWEDLAESDPAADPDGDADSEDLHELEALDGAGIVEERS